MLTIYLVEDERIELELLRNHVDWESMGIRVAGAAKNGRIAWEQVRRIRPDIVLTDVRMPIMDGLQLASRIRADFDWMKIVFLSGHDEFQYVKAALQTGAVGYMLKPINRSELSAVIAKVKEEVEKERLIRVSKHVLIDRLIEELYRTEGGAGGEGAWQELIRIAPRFETEPYVTALLAGDRELAKAVPQLVRSRLEAHRAEGTLVKLPDGEWALAVRHAAGADYEPLWRSLIAAARSEFGCSLTIGIADRAAPLRQARAMLEEAGKAADERFYAGHGGVHHASRIRPENGAVLNAEDEALLGEFHPYDPSVFAERVEHYFDMLLRMRAGREQVYSAATNALKGLELACAKFGDPAGKELGELRDWSRALAGLDTLPAIKSFLLELAEKLGRHMEERLQDRHLLLVREVAEHIDKAYAEPITIEQLAAKVYLSPNYLRALFKEKQGCTIHEYLTQVRLAKALELLRDRTLRIRDVARLVGYDNASYFCSFFYKTQGVTPNEYRKRLL